MNPTEFLWEEKAVLYSDIICAFALLVEVFTVLGLPPLIKSTGTIGLFPL